MGLIDVSGLPSEVTITNSLGYEMNFRMLNTTFDITIEDGDSLTFLATTSKELLYCISLTEELGLTMTYKEQSTGSEINSEDYTWTEIGDGVYVTSVPIRFEADELSNYTVNDVYLIPSVSELSGGYQLTGNNLEIGSLETQFELIIIDGMTLTEGGGTEASETDSIIMAEPSVEGFPDTETFDIEVIKNDDLTRLGTPTTVAYVEGTDTLSWDNVDNADGYDWYLDDEKQGSCSNPYTSFVAGFDISGISPSGTPKVITIVATDSTNAYASSLPSDSVNVTYTVQLVPPVLTPSYTPVDLNTALGISVMIDDYTPTPDSKEIAFNQCATASLYMDGDLVQTLTDVSMSLLFNELGTFISEEGTYSFTAVVTSSVDGGYIAGAEGPAYSFEYVAPVETGFEIDESVTPFTSDGDGGFYLNVAHEFVVEELSGYSIGETDGAIIYAEEAAAYVIEFQDLPFDGESLNTYSIGIYNGFAWGAEGPEPSVGNSMILLHTDSIDFPGIDTFDIIIDKDEDRTRLPAIADLAYDSETDTLSWTNIASANEYDWYVDGSLTGDVASTPIATFTNELASAGISPSATPRAITLVAKDTDGFTPNSVASNSVNVTYEV